MLVHFDKATSQNQVKEALENGDDATKADAMKKVVLMLLNGEQMQALFIPIVRYVLPSEDHYVQKLLLLYLVRGNPTKRTNAHERETNTRKRTQPREKKKNREKTKKKKKRTVGRTKTRNIRGMNLASLGTRADREKKGDQAKQGRVEPLNRNQDS